MSRKSITFSNSDPKKCHFCTELKLPVKNEKILSKSTKHRKSKLTIDPIVQSIEALADKEGTNFQDITSQVAVRYFHCRDRKLANIYQQLGKK